MSAFQTGILSFWNTVLGILKSFSLKDAIDIILVTFIIYSAIKLVRETRAGQLVKGIILLLVAFLLSWYLDLLVLNKVLTSVFQYTVFALLIVFQPEIRKALEQMGRSQVGKSLANVVGGRERSASREQSLKCIDSVVNAVISLQRLKMGALIVFERSTKLGEVVETGTVINAEPSAQLISNIFFNKAPLHDGAMIIRNGQVLAAGCILPLSKNDNISSSLGTRHRAALGVSEESDALVLVVSEETAKISLAINGILRTDYTRITLFDELEKYLTVNEEKKTQTSKRFLGVFDKSSKRKGKNKDET